MHQVWLSIGEVFWGVAAPRLLLLSGPASCWCVGDARGGEGTSDTPAGQCNGGPFASVVALLMRVLIRGAGCQ